VCVYVHVDIDKLISIVTHFYIYIYIGVDGEVKGGQLAGEGVPLMVSP